jgi:glycosyltransferase involved in cell wall biosynthesis
MKILKIIHGYPPSYNAGSEVYSQTICNELKQRHQVAVFTREANLYRADYSLRYERKDGLDFYIVNKAREKDGYQHPAVDAHLAKVVDAFQPDVAHIGHLNHLSTGLVEVLHQRGIPIVFTLHDFWLLCPRGQFLQINFGQAQFYQLCDGQEDQKCAQQCYSRFFSGQAQDQARDLAYWTDWIASRMAQTRQLCQQVDLFLAPAQSLRQRFIRDFDILADKILYLDYGFPTHYLRPPQPQARPIYTFAYIGTHIPSKGINLLIEAFSRLEQPARLLIFGREQSDSTPMLKAMASQSRHPIEFRGEYRNEDLVERVFAQVDCIVVPSIWVENSPLVIHEAQACRIPVITANAGGMAEYVRHLENGLLFEHRSAESLGQQLQFALTHPELMRRLGQRGYLYHPQGQVPSVAEHCQQLEQHYQRLVQKKFSHA